jgi:hypothetical protein
LFSFLKTWRLPHVIESAGKRAPRGVARTVSVFVAAAFLAPAAGCVQRRLTILSNPPGAMVYVGDEEIGTTPVSTDFVYYGNRKIRLEKPGFETLKVDQPIPAPWYQIPPLDVVSDNFALHEVRDERFVTFDLAPQVVVPQHELLRRADGLRQANGGPASPRGGSGPPRDGSGSPAELNLQ